MLRRNTILTAAALALCCALAPGAAADPFTDAERKLVDEYQAQQSVGAVHAGPGPFTDSERKLVEEYQAQQSVGAAHAGPGPYTDAERKLVESPEVQQMLSRIAGEISASSPVVAVSAPSGGFDWGDAGIGAAGMLALFSIAAGSALLIAGRRRRQGFGVATH
jgi:hypothetical protein